MRLPIAEYRDPLVGLLGMTAAEVAAVVKGEGLPGYRARQITEWIYERDAQSFDAMSNLPKGLREGLAARFRVYAGAVIADAVARDQTRKLLVRWDDGQTSECVLIPDEQRRTACISSQVGCPVGCTFCASGLDGVTRNLTAAQIVEQVMRIRHLCLPDGRLSNVVFMGLGEPLANYDQVVTALRIINELVGIGARRITISTVGLPDRMRRLADEKLQVTLALSLHAPTDELRSKLIPWAERVTLAELVDACCYYFDRTGREITLEYVLLKGENDSLTCANGVAVLCKRMRANVNLIRYNPVTDLPFQRPDSASAQAFLQRLRDRGVNAHLRRSRGLDQDAACGQLRRRLLDRDAPAGSSVTTPTAHPDAVPD